VVVDDSGAAGRAGTVAVDLAAAVGGRLVAVSVVDGGALAEGTQADGGASTDGLRAAQAQLRDLARQVDVDVEARTVHGQDADELLHQARAVGADLIVVGCAHLDGGVHTADHLPERLMAFCAVPVLAVPVHLQS
jgi:nucleotide-binding universal stress UspA family protein